MFFMVDEKKMKDDKFILMGLNDDSSKHVAEVLKNDTCKKILDFLAETREASEKDISDGLEIPINTVEYNLKKLIKARLVTRSGNFFWSVKGKRIPMYKLAKKHIIISPGKKPSLSYLKTLLPVILVLAGLLAIAALFMLPSGDDEQELTNLKRFSSYDELKAFLQDSSDISYYYGGSREVMNFQSLEAPETMAATSASDAATSAGDGSVAKTSADDFSTTNIQVEGVDEADIVKNDGKYIYVVSGNKVIIIDAYPAADMENVSEIELNNSIINIFINGDKLIIFTSEYKYIEFDEPVDSDSDVVSSEALCLGCGGSGKYVSVVKVYDISDKENPELEDEYSVDGNYRDSRMIGNYVYVIANKYINVQKPIPPIFEVNSVARETAVEDVHYWDYSQRNYVFTSVVAINLDDADMNSKVYLTGGSGVIYVSEDNIYLTNTKYVSEFELYEEIINEVIVDVLPKAEKDKVQEIMDSNKTSSKKMQEVGEIVEDYSSSLTGDEKAEFDEKLMKAVEETAARLEKEREKTVIHKIKINGNKIKYVSAGTAPGRLLNQFSMGEYEGNLRIATTTGNTWQDTSLNHVYVLDEDLEIIGSVEDLAKGERIYSVRFLGDKVYMVTFRQVDPFYVIDLSDPENPEVLGYLKIPGYSSYLHPYDEDHIIGVGVEDRKLKLSLYDVSDFENPEEVDKYIVDGEYSSSDALYDHKAFLFDKEKQLLVIPVSQTIIVNKTKSEYGYWYNNYKYWRGAFVFNIDKNGFDLDAKISHSEEDEDYYSDYVRRSLYMDDVLYTISNYKIKANSLEDYDEISSLEISSKPIYYARGFADGTSVDTIEVEPIML